MKKGLWLGLVLAAVLLSACGNSGTGTTSTASPTPGGSVTPSPGQAAVVVIAASPQGPSGPTVPHLVRLDGSEATQVTVKARR